MFRGLPACGPALRHQHGADARGHDAPRGRAFRVTVEHRRELEGRALAQAATHRDVPAHEVHQPAADVQSQARAAEVAGGGCVGLHEGPEQARQHGLVDADARVHDLEAQGEHPRGRRRVFGASDDQTDRAVMGELDGVAAQVDQNLLEPQRVADQAGREAGQHGDRQFVAVREGPGGQDVPHLVQQRVQIEGSGVQRHLVGLDLGQVQNVVDDAHKMVCRGADLEQILAQPPFGLQLEGQVQKSEDGGHGRADLVAHAGQKRTLGPGHGFGRLALHGHGLDRVGQQSGHGQAFTHHPDPDDRRMREGKGPVGRPVVERDGCDGAYPGEEKDA
ncbi:hypothetical protein DSECCO2_348250 [anaerobic digester metagenome]